MMPVSPPLLEVNLFGVFAAGDLRGGSIKPVGSAVGEGSFAISFVHQMLKNRHKIYKDK
jgi:thioredoxin reductase (NADPH)